MPINISGTWRDTKAWWVKVSGTWREGSGVFVKVSGTWREEAFTAPLTATLAPSNVSGFAFSPGPATTGNCTTTPIGGVEPYSYLWQKVSGDTITVNNPTSAVTKFTSFGPADSSVYRCRVTDNNSTEVFTNNVSITLTVEP